MEFRWISSLEKVFSDESLMASSITEATALRGERFSVQCATYYDGNDKLYGDVAVSTDLPGDVLPPRKILKSIFWNYETKSIDTKNIFCYNRKEFCCLFFS